MSATKWVQHRSGIGQRFPVTAEDAQVWISWLPNPHRDLVLPKSEYEEIAA